LLGHVTPFPTTWETAALQRPHTESHFTNVVTCFRHIRCFRYSDCSNTAAGLVLTYPIRLYITTILDSFEFSSGSGCSAHCVTFVDFWRQILPHLQLTGY